MILVSLKLMDVPFVRRTQAISERELLQHVGCTAS